MALYRARCDSFFVEDPEENQRRLREEMREREKFAKQQTQRAIADDLSRLASYEYREDILEQMEKIEVSRHFFCANQTGLPFRCLLTTAIAHRPRLYQTLPQLTFKPRFSGLCDHICLTS